MARRIYCPSCGDKVHPIVARNQNNVAELFCNSCGLPLEESPEETKNSPRLNHVVLAEDSLMVQEIISDVLVGQGLAKRLSTCINGEEVVARVTSLLTQWRKVDLIIMDVSMPGMNGLEAAKSLRALEKGLDRKKPIPILFFTSRQCDEEFKKILRALSPAMYVNKGADSSAQRLQERFEKVIHKLLELQPKKAEA